MYSLLYILSFTRKTAKLWHKWLWGCSDQVCLTVSLKLSSLTVAWIFFSEKFLWFSQAKAQCLTVTYHQSSVTKTWLCHFEFSPPYSSVAPLSITFSHYLVNKETAGLLMFYLYSVSLWSHVCVVECKVLAPLVVFLIFSYKSLVVLYKYII